MYGVGHVDGIVAVFPAFGSLEKVAGKGSTIGKQALRVTQTMDKLEVFFFAIFGARISGGQYISAY
jgi:hypothetical protein